MRLAVNKQKLGEPKSKHRKDRSKQEKAKNRNAMAKHEKAAKPKPTKASVRVLNIGAGSGYLTSAFYHPVRDSHGHEGRGNGDNAQQAPQGRH